MDRFTGGGVWAVILLSGACGREAARADLPADLSGTYTYVGADTAALLPWAARADLMLHPDSSFHFELRLRVKDDNQRKTASGTYRVVGDRLVLQSADTGQGEDAFELRIRGDSLVMEVGWVGMAALRLIGVPQPVLGRSR
ncbi:MAG TPA: hypothetical protein VNI61_01270 [Gemmatimonadales bacterium]|nr:hypothetical protein [Gemmatimonadales bacterium]